MATYDYNPNRLVTCPYDPAHKLLASRMQTHITKCKLNHLDKIMKRCCFNAQHLVTEKDYQFHILNCADRLPLEKYVANLDENDLNKGRTAVPPYSGQVLESSENWDDEIANEPVAGYLPKHAADTNGIVGDLEMTKPAERKKFYRQLPNDAQYRPTVEAPVTPVKPAPTRQPKHSHESILNVRAGGIGREQPVAAPQVIMPPSSRIAANIYGDISRQPKSSHEQILRNVGIGRGNGLRYEDFPTLGSN